MKRLVFLLCLGWSVLGVAQSVTQNNWSDEFNTPGSVDATKWFHQTQLPNGYSWYNGEIQHYTNRDTNAFVQNGKLHIVALNEQVTQGGVTKSYSSARLNSKAAFLYGRMEVRAKLPSGVGTWPAIWMLGQNITEPGGYWQTQGYGTTPWPQCGEIDVMEHWGTNQNYVQSAVHTPSSFGNTQNLGGQFISTASSAFHTYALDWYPDSLVFSVDGNKHYTYAPTVKDSLTWPFDQPQYALLNFAVLPSISSSFVSDTLIVDYVRITPIAAPVQHNVGFQVDMTNYSGNFSKVYVSGNFNNWSGNSFELTDPDNDQIYTGTLPLLPGNYEYKFTTDNWSDQEWLDPVADSACTLTSYGFTNRLAAVGKADTTLSAVCWEECLACATTPTLPTVGFAVDMNSYTGSFSTVYVSGNFNGWSGNANALSDPDGDGIWTGSLTLNPGLLEWKFTLDNWSNGETFTPGDPCTLTSYGFTNRSLTLALNQNYNLPAYCWESCSTCPGAPAPAPPACIQCDSLSVGDFFVLNGDSIEVVDRTRLLALVAAQADLTKVCVSHITDMKNVFRGAKWFNQDISRWDVSNVTTFRAMFFNAETFNQNLSSWDVGAATDLTDMFFRADSFNQPVGVWDVSQVALFSRMFKEAGSFQADLSAWDVSSAVRMGEMFRDAANFDGDLSSWCVPNFEYYNVPTDFETGSLMGAADLPRWGNCPNTYDDVNGLATGAFVNAAGCVDCSALNVGDYFELGGDTLLVVNRDMLDSLVLIRADLSKICVSHITDMTDALRGQTWFNTNISGWDVSGVTSMNNMFRKALFFNQDIGNWDVSGVTNMSRAFYHARAFNQDIGGWDVSAVTRFNTTFKRAVSFNQDLSGWDVSSAFNMDNMFRAANSFSQDLSSWCVPLIPSKPTGFDANSGLSTSQLPQWGCGSSALVSQSSWRTLPEAPIEPDNRTPSIYPNPTNGIITLQPAPKGKFILLNEYGQVVKSGNISKTLNLSTYTSGIYLLRLETPEGIYCLKVVKL